MKRLFSILLFAALTACATAPQSPAQTVYAIQGAYAGALTAAVAYKALPACSATVPLPCSEKAVVARLQAADDKAYSALSTAQSLVRNGLNASNAIEAAELAVKAMTAITSTIRSK